MSNLKTIKNTVEEFERKSLLDNIQEINSNSSVDFFEDKELYTPLLISEDQYEGLTTYFN